MSLSYKCHGSGEIVNSQCNVFFLTPFMAASLCPRKFFKVSIILGALVSKLFGGAARKF